MRQETARPVIGYAAAVRDIFTVGHVDVITRTRALRH